MPAWNLLHESADGILMSIVVGGYILHVLH